jgi:hypothetical protein
MKPLLTAVIALSLAACEAEKPPGQEVRDQFERGISGHGQFVPVDHQETPNSEPNAGGPAPGNL